MIAESTKASVADMVEQQLNADYVLNGGGQAQFPATVSASGLADAAGRAVGGRGAGRREDRGKTTFAVAPATARGDPVTTSGWPSPAARCRRLDSGGVLVDDSVPRTKLQVGTALTGTVGALRDVRLSVGGIVREEPG